MVSNINIKKIMAKRVITKIGDVFCANIDGKHKRYLQYIVSDLSQLNSDVVRIFKKKYPLETNIDLSEIIKDEVDFYSHCVTSAGVKKGLWEKVGNIREVGKIEYIIFKCKFDFTSVEIQNDWEIWKINEESIRVGKLNNKYKQAYLGLIFHPEDIIHKLKTGVYPGVFAKFE